MKRLLEQVDSEPLEPVIKRKKKKKKKECDKNFKIENATNEKTSKNEESEVDKEEESFNDNVEANIDNDLIETEKSFPVLGIHTPAKKAIVKNYLPKWLEEPLHISASIESGKILVTEISFLNNNTLKNLDSAKIRSLYPVQACVIPKIMAQNNNCSAYGSGIFPPSDICVQAPTGSGKTLSYVLPIVEILSRLTVRQLYCLVVLPSKDLAMQVKQVFDFYSKGTHLQTALVSGFKTFSKEQEQLVYTGRRGSFSKVDIVICTPGRLVDHLKFTTGFTLKHIRFLVVDEADRLLGQDYSGWLESIWQSVYSPSSCRRKLVPLNANAFQKNEWPFQKLLFSATLTQNPEKLAQLDLFNPICFSTYQEQIEGDVTGKERFTMPDELSEKFVQIEVSEKPLVLIYLMLTLKYKNVLCFTNSVEATHRLYLLLQHFKGFTVAEFSSKLNEVRRKGIIRDFKNGNIDLLISSDAMARGMDMDNVKLVVNYDAAANAKIYVHRVGRTARAGNIGEAIALLSWKEVYHFLQMRKELSAKSVSKMKISTNDFSTYEQQYEIALSHLQDSISEERKAFISGKTHKKMR